MRRIKKSKRDWLRSWKQHDPAESENAVWREPPVGILDFAERFLQRSSLTQFHRDALVAFAGENPSQWDEKFTVVSLCWGMGAGKNFTAEIMVAYTLYRLVLLTDPRAFFGFGKGASGFIDILNVSFVNETQAKQIFFDRMKMVIRSTTNPVTRRNWFAEQGIDLRDRGIGDMQEKIIQLPNNVRARCLPFTEVGFEGSDIVLAIIDEPSRAVQSPPDNERAHRLFDRMLQNMTSRFQRRGKLVLFSYPEAQDDDLIMELFDQAGTQFTGAGRSERSGGNPDYYASRGATYEVNPRVKREDFDNTRKANPESTATRIDCQPPHSKTGFYRAHPEKIAESFQAINPRNGSFTYEVVPIEHRVQSNGQLVTHTYTGIRLVKAFGDREHRSLGGDPGETGDTFALALARAQSLEREVEATVIRRTREHVAHAPGVAPHEPHQSRIVDRATNLTTGLVDRTVWVDGIAEIVPIRYTRTDPKTGRPVSDTYPISFISVVEFILQLKMHFPNLYCAAFDRWSSNEMIEELIKAGIDAQALTFSAQDQYSLYTQHRSLAYNDLIKCIPCPRAEQEFVDLQEVTPGRKVDHKPGGSKDVSDAIVIATHLALKLDLGGGDFYLGLR
jgi:hypothetical protein